MPILVDYNAMYLSSVFKCMEQNHNDDSSFRHFFLNSLSSNKKKFKSEFGDIVICADHKYSWRKKVFPYYKARRSEDKIESAVDWDYIHKAMSEMYDDLREVFPYKTIKVDFCEADDSIGTICHKNGKFLNDGSEKFLILSRDKDYKQLQRYSNVQQYAPTIKSFVIESNPDEFLQSQIIRGDTGDGVPNILSADNTLAIRERQTTITAKRYNHYKIEENRLAEPEVQARWLRNKKMVDLSEIPDEYQEEIIRQYSVEKKRDSNKLFNYFISKRLKLLMENIQDF